MVTAYLEHMKEGVFLLCLFDPDLTTYPFKCGRTVLDPFSRFRTRIRIDNTVPNVERGGEETGDNKVIVFNCTTIREKQQRLHSDIVSKKFCPSLYSESLYVPPGYTVCPRSIDPIYIVSYYINWVTTSLTYSTVL